jgi:multisubunit Na+/H+ antiporter MnhC subunit
VAWQSTPFTPTDARPRPLSLILFSLDAELMKKVLTFALFSAGVAILFWITGGHELQYTVFYPDGRLLHKREFSIVVCIVVSALVGVGGAACMFLLLFLVRRLRGKPLDT